LGFGCFYIDFFQLIKNNAKDKQKPLTIQPPPNPLIIPAVEGQALS
jgi:hypothetical protein